METNRGRAVGDESDDGADRPEDQPTTENGAPRYPASRLRPRIESVAPEEVAPAPPLRDTTGRGTAFDPVLGVDVASDLGPEPARRSYGFGPGPVGQGPLNSMFGPRTFGGGKVQVWGCSPGCLVVSLLVSLFLTLFLNGFLSLLF